MIAADTNVLIRLLVEDDPIQEAAAKRLLLKALETEESCFISDPVLCEVEWVLESSYGASRADVLAAFQNLLAQEVFVFEDSEALRRAITSYSQGKVEISDLLIGAKNQTRGARTTYTFDRVLSRQPGFSLLG